MGRSTANANKENCLANHIRIVHKKKYKNVMCEKCFKKLLVELEKAPLANIKFAKK